jgi:hypothetical protein
LTGEWGDGERQSGDESPQSKDGGVRREAGKDGGGASALSARGYNAKEAGERDDNRRDAPIPRSGQVRSTRGAAQRPALVERRYSEEGITDWRVSANEKGLDGGYAIVYI